MTPQWLIPHSQQPPSCLPMSIRFACTRCHQKLAIAARKAGARIQCPKCQTQLTVPTPTESLATLAKPAAVAERAATPSASTSAAPAKGAPPKTVVSQPKIKAPPVNAPPQRQEAKNPSFSSLNLDVMISAPSAAPGRADVPTLRLGDVPVIETSQPTKPGPAVEAIANELAVIARGSATAPGSRVVVDPSLVAVPRGMLYAQAVVLVLLALTAFVLGYWTGRAVSPPAEEVLAALTQPMSIEGDLVYRAADGADLPDAGAIVIAVPHERAPRDRLPIEGLRPQDRLEDDQMNPAILALENEGGAYARVAATGQFVLTARPGRYWLLAVSANATRGEGTLPRVRDVSLLGKYFEQSANLLENRRYRLVEVKLPDDAPLELALD